MSWALNTANLQSPQSSWLCMASDATGSKLWAGVYGGDIWRSTDGGITWTPTGDPNVIGRDWRSIASDASGVNLIAASYSNGGIFVSKDGGVTWTLSYSLYLDIYSVASDASGVNLYAASFTGGIIISNDGGNSWYSVYPISNDFNIISVACSSDGTYVVATATNTHGGIVYSSDGGTTWGQSEPYRIFTYVACDSTGQYIIVCESPGDIWLSTNGGVTMTPTGNPKLSNIGWKNVKSDSTGTTLVACGLGVMWISKNSGATWTQKFINDTAMNWYCLASDSTGTNLAAAASGGDIWTSKDGGSTWTAMNVNPTLTTNFYGIRSDSTGSNLVICQVGGYIYTSSDTGTTWIKRTNAGYQNWYSLASDSTGLKLVACVGGGDIWRSTDGGVTWTPTGNPSLIGRIWWGITSDSTGSNLAACVFLGDIWRSTDGGATWTPTGNPSLNNQYWSSITSDSTGLNLAACVYGNYIYISKDGGATWTPRGSALNWYGITSDATGSNLVACTIAQQDIWHSRDGGDTWTPTGNPSVAATQFALIASDARGINLFAGSVNPVGVWQSFDGGSTWSFLSGTSGLQYTGLSLNAAGTLGAICGYSSANVGTATFTPPSPILPPPLDSQITGDIRPEVFETSIKYNWTTPATGLPDYYTLELSPNPGGSPYAISTFQTSYTVTGVTPGQSYEAYMTDTAYGHTSDPTSFRTVIPGNVPGVPQDISANFLSATSAIVNWTQPLSNGGSPVQWYVVVATPADLVTPPTYKSARGYNSSRIIDGLDVQDYSFSVVAVNDPGYSQYLSTPVITNPGVGP